MIRFLSFNWYIVKTVVLGTWIKINSSFRFRYVAAAFAATAVAQLFFGTQLIIWMLSSVAAFLISWITSPDELQDYYKLAILYIIAAIGIVLFTDVAWLATVLVSLAVPLLWTKVVFDTILHAKNKNLDTVIITFNSVHIVIVVYYILSVVF